MSRFVLYVVASHLNIVFQITNPRKIKQPRTIQPETAGTKMTTIFGLQTASQGVLSFKVRTTQGIKSPVFTYVTGLPVSNIVLVLNKCLLLLLIIAAKQNSCTMQIAAPPAILFLLSKPQSILQQLGQQLKCGDLGR